MNPNVKAKILDRPRAKEWAKWQPDEPTPDEMRRRLGAEGTSDEELLLRWIVGKEDIDAMRANPRPLEYLNSEQPLQQSLNRRRVGILELEDLDLGRKGVRPVEPLDQRGDKVHALLNEMQPESTGPYLFQCADAHLLRLDRWSAVAQHDFEPLNIL